MVRRTIFLLVFFASSVLATGAERTDVLRWRPEREEALRAAGLEPSSLVIPDELTEEMKAWARAQVRPGRAPEEKLQDLLAAMIDPEGLALEYQAGYTATAEEVFSTGKANCLAFTHLFVAMAREIGVPTLYMNIPQIERFRRRGDLVVVSGHVTAGYGEATERYILEFGLVSEANYGRARPISDLNALARYYANRSAELLQESRTEEALEAAGISARLDPELPDAWTNLGVTRRRSGDLTGAEEAYRRAIEIDSNHFAAYHNLSLLYRLRGEKDAAGLVLALLDRRANRNPFIFLDLGDASVEEGQTEEAGRFYRRAVRLGDDLAEPRAALGLWLFEQGQTDKARRWLRRALALDPTDSRTQELEQRLSSFEEERELESSTRKEGK